MTSSYHRIYPNLYKDSVALMSISATLGRMDGVEMASLVMATDANLGNLRDAGFGELDAGPNDLVVAVRGDQPTCAAALERADELLAEQAAAGDDRGAEQRSQPATSLRTALAHNPAHNLALISVPGAYAAAEALKALQLGMHVMIFSDNVPVEQEIEVKCAAEAGGLLVMGPDCGTAIVGGLPLGFSNAVRRGRIGVVGASGTGLQEVTCRVHQAGEGISQALGTGGHDLSSQVGGISMLRGLRALAEDETTEVIVLVSKPPADEVAKTILDEARGVGVPVVVNFVGADPTAYGHDPAIHPAGTLAQAADIAVALARDENPELATPALSTSTQQHLRDLATRFAPGQHHIRGVFCGGTFCSEAQLVCRSAGIEAFSNAPAVGNPALADIQSSRGHTILDIGDDAFTGGRPHPMIDPALRDERLLAEAADPGTAVLLFDVVLGYGAAANAVSGLLGTLEEGRARAAREDRALAVVAHVCGTGDDPQDRAVVVEQLRAADVLVAESNAQAASMAACLISPRSESAEI